MARRRSGGQVSLNFDGLTDAVTNLTGTLILLVVLVFGITTEAKPPPPPPETSEGKPINPLLQKIEVLKLHIQQVDRQIQELEGDLPALQQQVEELRRAARSGGPRGEKTANSLRSMPAELTGTRVPAFSLASNHNVGRRL